MEKQGIRIVICSIGAFSCVGLASLLLYYDVLLSYASHALVVQEKPIKADALVVMLGGHRIERILKAAQLYHHSWSPKVVLGSGYIKRASTPWWNRLFQPSSDDPWIPAGRWYRRNLIKAGVPERRLTTVSTPHVFDSAGELKVIVGHLVSTGVESAIFVSSATHSKRLKIILDRLAPPFRTRIIGADVPHLNEWWKHQNLRRQVIHEYGALVKEMFRQLYQSVLSMRLS